MTNQTDSLPHRVLLPRRGQRHAWSSRHATSLGLHERGVAARQILSFPLLGADERPTRILVVDDVNTTGPLVYRLHGLGYWATRVASSGESALHLAREFLPSVVLVGLDLPNMSPYRVAARLREQAAGWELRIIGLTNDYMHADRDLARTAGFERYLVKPVSALALHQLLHVRKR